MALFELKGEFREKKIAKVFTKRIDAENQNYAKEKLFSLFGSQNRIARRNIKINSVAEAKQ
ncbi:MAG: 50S ribosomal protein L18Ae [Candidatus Diapherotrites archaeon]|nr:50S ribosomal protein L18Ae [Candidatus Diapherotrites archaeon]